MRLINIDELPLLTVCGEDGLAAAKAFAFALNSLRTVDAVEVVRCKDCKHYIANDVGTWCNRRLENLDRAHTCPNGFCSYGERKEASGNEHDAE